MKGELVDYADWDTGSVRGLDHVFGLGNVLTGKGNIKESRKSSAEISNQVLRYLGLAEELSLDERTRGCTCCRPKPPWMLRWRVARPWRRTRSRESIRACSDCGAAQAMQATTKPG